MLGPSRLVNSFQGVTAVGGKDARLSCSRAVKRDAEQC
jgi:hypothetical protein